MVLNVDYLKELMEAKNWSERELGRRAGISGATVSRILTGKRGVGSRTFTALHNTFPEVPIEKLFFFAINATER